MESLIKILPHFVTKPDIYQTILDVINDFPNHCQFIHSSLENADEIVSVILMIHRAQSDPMRLSREIEHSHKQVYNILSINKPTVIGFEGSAAKEFTFRKWAEETVHEAKVCSGVDLSPHLKSLMRMMKKDTKGNGIAAYMRKNPKVSVTGMEDAKLNIVQQVTLLYSQKGLEYQDMYVAALDIRKIRSMLGIVKLLVRMRELKSKKGAVVIGFRHGPELEELMRERGLENYWQFYNTVPEYLRTID